MTRGRELAEDLRIATSNFYANATNDNRLKLNSAYQAVIDAIDNPPKRTCGRVAMDKPTEHPGKRWCPQCAKNSPSDGVCSEPDNEKTKGYLIGKCKAFVWIESECYRLKEV